MSEKLHTKVLVIGSGPAGYTAAIYAARANLEPLIITGMEPGGQLTITTEVENYPGFADPIQGPWLMEQMKAQAEHVGTTIKQDMVIEVNFEVRPFEAKTDSGLHITADTVIISTGAKARWLGLESEYKFQNLGVSACATCDGFFYRGKKVAVIGGGNSAVEEALFLSNLCEHVTLVHRRDSLRAEKIAQDRLFEKENITVVWDHVVQEVVGIEPGGEGTPGVTGVVIEHVKTGETKTLEVEGMFVAIGHDPATELFKGKIDMDSENYILVTPGTASTNIPGVFAAGDVSDKVYRQAVTAAGMGCMAALEADKYIQSLESGNKHAEAAE